MLFQCVSASCGCVFVYVSNGSSEYILFSFTLCMLYPLPPNPSLPNLLFYPLPCLSSVNTLTSLSLSLALSHSFFLSLALALTLTLALSLPLWSLPTQLRSPLLSLSLSRLLLSKGPVWQFFILSVSNHPVLHVLPLPVVTQPKINCACFQP